MKIAIVTITAILIAGCTGAGKDFLKALESKAYDTAAKGVSEYCDRIQNLEYNVRELTDEERVQARREIRQRGSSGPSGPDGNPGPVVVIWCDGDEPVPTEVWKYFEKGDGS